MKRSTAGSPFPWFGGKQKLAETIAAMFPPHNVYVEVFGGGASVLFAKKPSALEVYNDKDDGLVSFFRALRDHPDQLVPLLELSPYARSEWDDCRRTWMLQTDPVEKARRWYVTVAQSFGGFPSSGINHETGGMSWLHSTGRGWGGERLGRMHLGRAASSANRVDNVWRFVERLRIVQVDNLDWSDCLKRYDHPEALFYIDPPYIPETRRSGGYTHELTLADHRRLIAAILRLEGAAIVSGYDHDLYAKLVQRGGFTRHEFGVWATAAAGRKGQARDRRIEIVWASPGAAVAPRLFHDVVEA